MVESDAIHYFDTKMQKLVDEYTAYTVFVGYVYKCVTHIILSSVVECCRVLSSAELMI